MTVSICIPTYKRVNQLKEALDSCVEQTLLPTEILIGDDSPDDATARFVASYTAKCPVPIRYYHNKPSLKQALNVNMLMMAVQTDLLLLLHDDDVLTDNAVKDLTTCFETNPQIDVAYGKQYWMSDDGIIDYRSSEGLNYGYYRTAEYEGTKLTGLEAGILQQFPNDCYLIRTPLAQKVGYSEEAGDGCDFDFGLKVGKEGAVVYYVNSYTAKYRNSAIAVTKNTYNDSATRSYLSIEDLKVPASSERYRADWLRRQAPIAVGEAINLKDFHLAKRIYLSKWHRPSLLTPGGIKRLLLLLKAYILKH